MEERMELLQDAYTYSIKLKKGIQDAAHLCEAKEYERANKFVVAIVDGLNWLSQALQVTKSIQRKEIEIKSIDSFLSEAVSALENRDYALLGELLEYELLPILGEWIQDMEASLE